MKRLAIVLFFNVISFNLISVVWADEAPDPDLNRAIDLFSQKEYRQSKKLLSELASQNPTQPKYWFNLANADFMLEQFAEAERSYEKVIALKSTLAPASHLYLAKCYRHEGNLTQAFSELDPLRSPSLPETLTRDVIEEIQTLKAKLIEGGLKALSEKDYDKAISQLENAGNLEDEADIELLLGSSYFNRDRIVEARHAFVRALSLNPDPAARENAEYFLERIQEALNQGNWSVRNPYWVSLDIAYGYNTNVWDAGVSQSPKNPAYVEDNLLSAGYIFNYGNPFFIRTSYLGAWDETEGMPENRSTSHGLSASLTYQANQWLLQGVPSFSYQTYGGMQPYLTQTGATLRAEKHWGAPGLGLSYQYLGIDVLNPTYSYLRGDTSTRKIYYTHNGNSTLTTLALFNVSDHSANQPNIAGAGSILPTEYESYGVEFDLNWFMSQRWALTWNTSYQYKHFDQRALPSLATRIDNEINDLLKFEFRVLPAFKIYLSGALDQNFSTLGSTDVLDKNYTQVTALGGVTWDILR